MQLLSKRHNVGLLPALSWGSMLRNLFRQGGWIDYAPKARPAPSSSAMPIQKTPWGREPSTRRFVSLPFGFFEGKAKVYGIYKVRELTLPRKPAKNRSAGMARIVS
ncbi:MAG: hypothetical protein QM605_03425 [Sphingobium sp.]